MNTEENWFCPQVGTVYRLQIDLKFCVVLLVATCLASVCAAQTTDNAPAASAKVIPTKLSGFGVPFQIDADDSSFIEVQLYLSRDAGKTWTFYGRKGTDEQEFPFQADQDGEYWFSLKTLSRDRRLLPEGDPQPELKILVDTVKPKLDVRIEADQAGRVVCRWQATDLNLAPSTVKLLYQPVLSDGTVMQWQTVPVNLGGVARNGVYTDQVGWWPETTEATVNVAIEIMDSAGNTVRQARKVNLPATGWRSRSVATALPNLAADANQQTTLKPATSGSGSKGLPQQPDWAYPGWKPPQELRQGNSKSPVPPAVPTNPASPNKTAKQSSGKPSGVVCENGVCRLAAKKDMPSRVDKPAPPVASPPRKQDSPRTSQRAPRTSKGALTQQPNRSTLPQRQRFASAKPPMPLVGSPEELVAPPVPAGYVARRQPVVQQSPVTPPVPTRTASASNLQAPSSINWESETENWKPKGRMETSGASPASKFDATITPLPTRQSPVPPSATNVPSNPGKMFFEGNKVIGQSSTMGRTNQYRGQRATVHSIPSPTLLPNIEGATTNQDRRVVSNDNRLPQTDLAPFQENPQLGSMQRLPAKNFTGAGFKRRSESTAKLPDNQRSPRSGSRQNVLKQPSNHGASVSGGIAKPNRSTRAPVQIIGSNRFRLNYGIDSIDPSGVGKVVLWMTRDDGQTWKTWGTDPDRRSPFPVEVTEQGRYGFRIVVQSKDGLTGQGPSSGDDADIWIVVDTTAPLAQITSVPYGRGAEAGKLVINYKVADPLLTLRPITISYAANPAGPWEIVKEGARNESRLAWKVSREVPEQIFLKIEAVDRAGNIGTHVLSQPVDVSGLVPRGTIHGVTPVGIN